MDAPPPDRPDGRPGAQPSPAALAGRRRRPGGHRRRLLAIWDHPSPPPTRAPPHRRAPPPARGEPATGAHDFDRTGRLAPLRDVMLCRDAWGAQPRPGGTPHTLTRMTIHHTAAVLGDNSNAPARLRQHQHYHQDSQGWIDIAYHISVDRNGNIYELRDPTLVGDTATSYDPTGHFLVVCEGDFDEEEVTEEQLNGAALAFAWAAQTIRHPDRARWRATGTPARTPRARARASTPTSPR